MTMGTGVGGNPTAKWQVTSQAEVTELGPNGQFTQGYKITFSLATGQTGSVFVPRQSYTEDVVRKSIAAWASRVARIGNLSG